MKLDNNARWRPQPPASSFIHAAIAAVAGKAQGYNTIRLPYSTIPQSLLRADELIR